MRGRIGSPTLGHLPSCGVGCLQVRGDNCLGVKHGRSAAPAGAQCPSRDQQITHKVLSARQFGSVSGAKGKPCGLQSSKLLFAQLHNWLGVTAAELFTAYEAR
jgi:hypothetical protein